MILNAMQSGTSISAAIGRSHRDPALRRGAGAGGVTVIAFLLSLLAVEAAADPLRVGTIAIRDLDIYTSEEASRGSLYRAANRLHIQTKLSVIRAFLLFREGEPYRPERLAETERNLRALRFIKSASVVASPPHDGVVDVTVTTQDSWSIAPETQAGNRGGQGTYGASIAESNLLGYGKAATISWDKGADRTRSALAYSDPAFFAPYWNANLAYGKSSDGYDHLLSVRRPFYSFATTWATDLTFSDFHREDRLYRDGEIAEQFRHERRLAVASYGIALNPSDTLASRLTAGVRLATDDFSTAAGFEANVLPTERDFRYVFVRFDQVTNDFVKLNYVNKDLRYEDFNLGRQLSIETAVSPRGLGADRNSGFVRLAAGDGVSFGNSGYLLPFASIESRVGHGFENAILSSSVSLVRRYETDHPQTFLVHLALNHGWNLDREVQFAADGGDGLRGYHIHSFTGTRALVLNVEHRLYLGRELFQLVSPAAVAFADVGKATNGTLFHPADFKTDAGFGIRLGLPRTPRNVLRLDFAYAFNRDPRGRRGWMASFSSGQAF